MSNYQQDIEDLTYNDILDQKIVAGMTFTGTGSSYLGPFAFDGYESSGLEVEMIVLPNSATCYMWGVQSYGDGSGINVSFTTSNTWNVYWKGAIVLSASGVASLTTRVKLTVKLINGHIYLIENGNQIGHYYTGSRWIGRYGGYATQTSVGAFRTYPAGALTNTGSKTIYSFIIWKLDMFGNRIREVVNFPFQEVYGPNIYSIADNRHIGCLINFYTATIPVNALGTYITQYPSDIAFPRKWIYGVSGKYNTTLSNQNLTIVSIAPSSTFEVSSNGILFKTGSASYAYYISNTEFAFTRYGYYRVTCSCKTWISGNAAVRNRGGTPAYYTATCNAVGIFSFSGYVSAVLGDGALIEINAPAVGITLGDFIVEFLTEYPICPDTGLDAAGYAITNSSDLITYGKQYNKVLNYEGQSVVVKRTTSLFPYTDWTLQQWTSIINVDVGTLGEIFQSGGATGTGYINIDLSQYKMWRFQFKLIDATYVNYIGIVSDPASPYYLMDVRNISIDNMQFQEMGTGKVANNYAGLGPILYFEWDGTYYRIYRNSLDPSVVCIEDRLAHEYIYCILTSVNSNNGFYDCKLTIPLF